jgi:hypothetical protein
MVSIPFAALAMNGRPRQKVYSERRIKNEADSYLGWHPSGKVKMLVRLAVKSPHLLAAVMVKVHAIVRDADQGRTRLEVLARNKAYMKWVRDAKWRKKWHLPSLPLPDPCPWAKKINAKAKAKGKAKAKPRARALPALLNVDVLPAIQDGPSMDLEASSLPVL